MKKNKLTEARNRNLAELNKDIKEAKQQLGKLRLEIITGKVRNARAVKNLRKDISQLETFAREKEINEEGKNL